MKYKFKFVNKEKVLINKGAIKECTGIIQRRWLEEAKHSSKKQEVNLQEKYIVEIKYHSGFEASYTFLAKELDKLK